MVLCHLYVNAVFVNMALSYENKIYKFPNSAVSEDRVST